MSNTKTIILIHGNYVNDHSWGAWKRYYEGKGYTVHAPANPGHGGEPAELRATVHPDLASTGFIDVVENIEELIDTLPEKPLVIGHSMAGMVVMKLVALDKVAAGVSIHGAPPRNVTPVPLQTIRTTFSSLRLASTKKTWMGTRAWFNRAFFNTLSESQRSEAFTKYAVPESAKVSRQILFNRYAKIDFAKKHVPLLFIGGDQDRIFPASFTRRIAGKYSDQASRLDIEIFDGRSHFTCGEPGWERVADHILEWFESL